MQPIQIAIDGPSGAGKSTIAKLLAQRLGYLYLDTGAMYRAAGLKALRMGLVPGDETQVQGIPACTEVMLRAEADGLGVYLDGEDVRREIREERVSKAASDISKHAAIRRWLQGEQGKIAQGSNVIMDGRDIGTRVLPNARYKYFITASAEERARRRFEELKSKGIEADYEQVLADIRSRDLQDSTRANDPLTQAPDAVLVDTTAMDIPQVLQKILDDMENRK